MGLKVASFASMDIPMFAYLVVVLSLVAELLSLSPILYGKQHKFFLSYNQHPFCRRHERNLKSRLSRPMCWSLTRSHVVCDICFTRLPMMSFGFPLCCLPEVRFLYGELAFILLAQLIGKALLTGTPRSCSRLLIE